MPRPAPRSIAHLAVACCLVALLAWGWSYLPSHFHTESRRGQLFLIYTDGSIGKFDSASPDFDGFDAMISGLAGQAPRNRRWQGLGFAAFIGEWPKFIPESNGAVMVSYVAVIVPYWSIVIVTGLVALLAIWRHRRAKRREFHGSCLSCGYDLRFSRDRCPECGSLIPQQEAAA
jgi:hypothetical protein